MSNIDPKHMAIINSNVSKYRGGDVPPSVIRSKALMIYSDSVSTYDPSKGSFEGYLSRNLMGLNRFVNSSMQIRMPEYKQQQVKNVMDTIHSEYGDDEDVDFKHIGGILNMKPHIVKSIYAGGTRGVVNTVDVEEFASANKKPELTQYDKDRAYGMMPSQKHKDVYDYTMGDHGKQALKTNMQIARELGISESYVRKIKNDIIDIVGKL